MWTGDFGEFSLLWIILNLTFVTSLIVGGVVLIAWLAKRSKRRRMKSQQPENQPLTSYQQLEDRYNRGELTREEFKKEMTDLRKTPG